VKKLSICAVDRKESCRKLSTSRKINPIDSILNKGLFRVLDYIKFGYSGFQNRKYGCNFYYGKKMAILFLAKRSYNRILEKDNNC